MNVMNSTTITTVEPSERHKINALIVYDSVYGNTEKIAKAIGSAIIGDAKVLRVEEVDISELKTFHLLIVGSPTQGGRPTLAIQDFLNRLSEAVIRGVKVAVFDTRMSTRFVGIFGFAAEKIVDSIKKKGGSLIAPPEGFLVRDRGRQNSLKEGELERAVRWAKEITK